MCLHTQIQILGYKFSLSHSPSYFTCSVLSFSRGWNFEMDLKQRYMLCFIMSIFQGENGLYFYWTECIQLQQLLLF